jgi:hypothetical protein
LTPSRRLPPADNDLLVGAFMASGEPAFIQRILASYSSADDAMISDGMPIGFMMSEFGPNLAAKGRNAVTDGPMVLAIAVAAGRPGQERLQQFLRRQPAPQNPVLVEQNAFANYLTTIIGLAGFPDSADLNRSAEMYEKLQPANAAFAPPSNTKK